jgi:hypothetical protein
VEEAMVRETMNVRKRKMNWPGDSVQLVLRLQGLGDPSIFDYIARTRAKYGRYSLPIEEVRKLVDKTMGERTLSQVLREMSESRH